MRPKQSAINYAALQLLAAYNEAKVLHQRAEKREVTYMLRMQRARNAVMQLTGVDPADGSI